MDAFNAIFAKALEGSKAMKVAAAAGDAAAYGAAMKTMKKRRASEKLRRRAERAGPLRPATEVAG